MPTLTEYKEEEKERAARRSFFQESRRLEQTLTSEQWWGLYKKLRRLARAELERAGRIANDGAIDEHLDARLPNILGELARLFTGDKESRARRAAIEAEGSG